MLELTCNRCGWVHFAVSRECAEEEVETFNKFYETLPPDQQKDSYGGKPSSIKQYEHCLRCGNSFKDFRFAKKDDCPVGCTIGPIIGEL